MGDQVRTYRKGPFRGRGSGRTREPARTVARMLRRTARPARMESQWSVDTAMPPGCPIKAKLALRAVGYEGIYHLPTCGSDRRLKRANRWFCSEKDALAEGFRKALTCR